MDLIKVLNHDLRSKIWTQLIRTPNINLSELAKKLGVQSSSVSDQIRILKKAKLVDTKYQSGKRSIALFCKPSMRGIYENIAKAKKKSLSDTEYKNIDKFYFAGKFRELLLKEFDKEHTIKGVDRLAIIITLLTNVSTTYFKNLAKHDRETLKEWKLIEPINRKLM